MKRSNRMDRSGTTRTGILAGVLALAVIGSGCGSRAKLTSGEESQVAKYEYDFATTVVDGGEFGGTLKGVDYLIGLCRKKPTAVYQVDKKDQPRTMREVVEDGANTLHEYHRDLADKLDRVARNGCK